MSVSPVLPRGTYLCDLEGVEVVKQRGGHWLVLTAVTDGAVRLEARHPLGRGRGAFDLAASQQAAWRQFAARLGIPAAGRTVEQVVGLVRGMRGDRVAVRLRHTPHGPRCRIGLPEDAAPTGQIDPIPATQRTDRAHALHERLLGAQRDERTGLALVCETCYLIRESDAYLALGYKSAAEYVAQPEVGMKRTSFYERARIFEWYCAEGGLDPRRLTEVGWHRLKLMLVCVMDGLVDAETAIDDGATLGWRDLNEKYRPRKDADAPEYDASYSPESEDDLAQRRDERAQRRLATAAANVLRALDRRATGDELETAAGELRDALGPFAEWAA